jgi:WD40 repeat protein
MLTSQLRVAILAVGLTLLDSAAPADNPERPKAGPPRLDLYGDPLPEGAVARLGTVRFRHGAYATSIAFTSDGKQLLSHGNNGVRVWDVATGKEIRSLLKTWVGSAAISPDGNFLITTESPLNRPVVRFRKWDDLTVEREFAVEDFNSSQFSPDGKVLAVATRRAGEIQLWDVAAGRRLHSWKAYEGMMPCFAFSDDSKTLVTGSEDKLIRLWDVATGKKKQEIVTPSIVSKAFVSSDGALVASLGMSEVKTGERSRAYFPENIIRIWDVASGKELRQIVNPTRREVEGRPMGFSFLKFAPNGKTLIALTPEGILRFWDSGTGKELRRLELGNQPPTTLGFSPDGKTLALGGPTIRLIDLAAGKDLVKLTGHQSGVSAAAFVLDGRTALTTSTNQIIKLWNPITGEERGSFTGVEEWAGNDTFLDKGRFLIARGPDDTIRVYDLVAKKEIRRIKIPPARSYYQALSPDGQMMALTAVDKGVILVNLQSGKERRLFQDYEVAIQGLGFGAEGRTVIAWFEDHVVEVWDLASSKNLVRFILGKQSEIGIPPALAGGRQVFFGYVAFLSADGRHFAYSSPKRFLALYDAASGKLVRRSSEFPCDISIVAFSPDNRSIAWASHDSIIHLLETATCQERHQFTGHQGVINMLAFSPDGRSLISGSEDTTALVWDLTGKRETKEIWGGRLTAADLNSCWSDLAGEDAAKAYQAIRRLAAAPVDGLACLGQRVRPVASVDPKHLAKLVADLDSNEFEVRETAEKELEKLGELAAPSCRKAVEGKPSSEVRRRLAVLIEKQTKTEASLPPDSLRAVRAVEVLEIAGTPKAQELLKMLASGAPQARLTQEAKASLERLTKRSTAAP